MAIHVVASIQIPPGQQDALLDHLRNIVPLVRNEDGCLEYQPTADLPTDIAAQSRPRNDVITIVEKWESLEALKAHLSAPHMIEYRKKVQSLVQRVTLHILTPID